MRNKVKHVYTFNALILRIPSKLIQPTLKDTWLKICFPFSSTKSNIQFKGYEPTYRMGPVGGETNLT